MPLTNAVLRTESGVVALSDATGYYQFTAPAGWSGTVTPERAGWRFTPVSRSYTSLTGDVSGQDFTGMPDLPVLSAGLSNGVPLLSWSARTGETYRVEVSRDLSRWDVLGEPVLVETNPAVRAVELEGYNRWFAGLAQPAREYRMVTGQVVLPPGSGLDLASLQVLGGQNTSGVTPEGEFNVFQPGGGPALVALMSMNQPVLLGYVGGPGGGVSAPSTANWLLFQAVGGYRLPPSAWSQALGLIHTSPEAQALAEVIGQCVATNPLALVQGEPAISNALWTAAGTLVKTNGSPMPPRRSRKDDPEDLQAGSFVIEGPYPEQQTGLRCEHNPEGVGLVLVNDYRRHLKYFVYRVGYEDAQGVVQELPAWEPVPGINDYLPGVNGVEGVREVLVGEATNEVFVINVQASLKPAETNLLIGEQALLTLKLDPVVPKGLSNLVYTWTLDGSSGSLSGANDLQRTYTASVHGWDVVKAKVQGDFSGKTYELREAKADLAVVPVRVSLKPSGGSMGQDRVLTLTAKVEPEPAEGQLVYHWQNLGPAGELIGGYDQQTSWPTNQFHSSATVEGTNRITVTAYLVTETETNQLGLAMTDVAVARWPVWQAPVELQAITSYTIGDWNRNGFPNLAVLTQEDRDPEDEGEPWSGVRILLNQSGHGFTNTFSFAATAAPAKSSSLDLVTADWNGDGNEDLVWAYDYRNTTQGHHTIVLRVLRGDGRGGFSLGAIQYLDPPETDPVEYHTHFGALSTGDIDGHGDLDLLDIGIYAIRVLLNNGDDTF